VCKLQPTTYYTLVLYVRKMRSALLTPLCGNSMHSEEPAQKADTRIFHTSGFQGTEVTCRCSRQDPRRTEGLGCSVLKDNREVLPEICCQASFHV